MFTSRGRKPVPTYTCDRCEFATIVSSLYTIHFGVLEIAKLLVTSMGVRVCFDGCGGDAVKMRQKPRPSDVGQRLHGFAGDGTVLLGGHGFGCILTASPSHPSEKTPL